MHLRDHPIRSVLLLLVAVPQAVAGLWAVVDPRGWYGSFPGFGHAWIAAYGAYDGHLATDAGAGLLATAVLLGAAAIAARRAELRMTLAGFLVFSGSHLAFHAREVGRLSRVDDTLSLASLVLAVLVPAGVLLSLRGRSGAGAPPPIPSSTSRSSS
jgi:hypothetical protein